MGSHVANSCNHALRAAIVTALTFSNAYAADWVCTGTNDWSNTSCWSAGALPIAGDPVFLQQTSGQDRTIRYDNTFNPGAVFGEILIDGEGGGAVTLNQGSDLSLNADSLILGRNGIGIINQADGTNTIAIGSIGARNGSSGIYIASNLASSVWDYLYVGNGGTGEFNQSGGSVVVNNRLTLGAENGSSGSYSLTGGTLTVNSEVVVGGWGAGSFYQDGGTHTVNGIMYISRKAGPLDAPPTTGTYTLNSGILNVTSLQVGVIPPVTINGTNTYPDVHEASNGHFIQNDGTVNIATEMMISASGGAIGRYELNNGALAASHITNNDTLDYRGGSIQADISNADIFAVSGPGVRVVNGSLINIGTSFFSQADYSETKHGKVTLADGTQMSIKQDLTLEEEGSLAIEFGGLFYATDVDWITVGGTARLGGTLDLSQSSGFSPVDGDSWTLLSSNFMLGSFSEVLFPVIPNWTWYLSYTETQVILSGSTSAVPLPAAFWLFCSGLIGVLGVVRRNYH